MYPNPLFLLASRSTQGSLPPGAYLYSNQLPEMMDPMAPLYTIKA